MGFLHKSFTNLGMVLLVILISGTTFAQGIPAGQALPKYYPSGVKLAGNQLQYDCAFDLLDWNGDGKLDIFLPNTSMMAYAVHLNEGTKTQPKFGHAVGYPVNLTETEPQTTEHNQIQCLCDLNHDGLFDMIFFDGQLRMDFNTGTRNGPNHWNLAKPDPFFPGTPKMIKENSRYVTGPESMYWNKGIFPRLVLTMTVADWDGDGLEDLLICRFKDEAPGVKPLGAHEQWTAWGHSAVGRPQQPPPPADAPTFQGKLKQAPERGVYFYKNVGTKDKPWFDAGVEIVTPDGQSIAAPNPVVMDMDADGIPDLVSTETEYSCNAYRVDWPTHPAVTWFRRPSKDDAAHLQPAKPVLDAEGKPVPAGVQAKFADFRGVGVNDLFVLDHAKGLRWYKNNAKKPAEKPAYATPTVLQGEDFNRFGFMYQPLVVNWFGQNSRDLIVHGCIDAHCKWALRRTALYKNTAVKPGEVKYEFAGWINYQGDLAMIPPTMEERHYDVYGSTVSLMPDDGTGKKRLVMSVNGQLYLFTDLSADGLTFRTRKPLNIPNPNRNRCKGWQDISVDVTDKVKYIRVSNDGNGQGNLRDSFLNIVTFEALAGGKNWATLDAGVTVKKLNKETVRWYQVQNPDAMFTPGNKPDDTKPFFTSFGYYIGPAVITLKEPVALDMIRFQLADRELSWYDFYWPFYWQGKLYRRGTEIGEPWYNYKVEVSTDEQKWTVVADRMTSEMVRSVPYMADWDGDGKVDLVLGVQNSQGIWPNSKEYRLYRNKGTNDDPKYVDFEPFCDENGKPLKLQANWYNAYAIQCGVAALDMNGDGKRDLVVEDYGPGLRYYQNISADPKAELKFKHVKELGDPYPISYPTGYRFFYVGDVDGDAIPDFINSASGNFALFRGVAAAAPSRTENLLITAAGKDGVEVQWTKPAGAVKYEIRWSDKAEITELNWATSPAVTGDYTIADGATQTVNIPGLPTEKYIYFALRSFNANKEASAISNCMETVTAPLKRIVLRNGPEGPFGSWAYAGTAACYLDASKPTQMCPQQPSALEVRAQAPGGDKQKVALIRFIDLPQLATVERAVLELTTDPTLQVDANQLQNVAALPISCNNIRDDWDAATATFTEAAAGKLWALNELDAGGTFLSKAPPVWTVQPRRTLRWDVTEAVRTAQRDGRNTISLLLRVDYTGKYIGGQGYKFCGPEWPAVDLRPRLVLVAKE
ncbi:MAG: FG-GAP repeat domain-containing protein [Armatimonadota bacterium]